MHIVPNVLLRSLCGWPRRSLQLLEELPGPNHPIVRFTYLSHMMAKKHSVFLSFLYTKRFDLGVEVAFYNGCVASNKIDPMILIAFNTFDSILVPLSECLCSSNPWEFVFSGFRRNRIDDLGINSPSL